MENTKLVRTAGILHRLVGILGVVMKVFAAVCVVFALLVILFGERMFAEVSLTLDLDFITLHLSEGFRAETAFLKLYAAVALAVGSVLCFLAAYGCTLLGRILAPMKLGRPFEESVSSELRKIGWLVIIGGGISELLGFAARILLTRAYPMEAVFAAEAIERIEYRMILDPGFVAVAVVIFFLSYIFRYGQSLQQLSDETL